MPQLLCDEMREYLEMFYSPNDSDRIFPISKSYLHHEMDRGSKSAGVKRIRIHDLRHSHVSLLINQGYQAAAIADRVGHETVEITDRYTHIYPSKQNEMANTLDAVSYTHLDVYKRQILMIVRVRLMKMKKRNCMRYSITRK